MKKATHNTSSNAPKTNWQTKLDYRFGLSDLSPERNLSLGITVIRGNRTERNATVALTINGQAFATETSDADGNVIFQVEAPDNCKDITFGGSIRTNNGIVTIKPIIWREEETPIPSKLLITPLGAIDGTYGFDVAITDNTGQIRFSREIQVISHGQVHATIAGSSTVTRQGERFRLPIGKDGEIIRLKPMAKETRTYLCISGGGSKSETFVLKQAEEAEKPQLTGLKVRRDEHRENIFHITVEGTNASVLAAGIQAYSDDGTKITVTANGAKIDSGDEAKADFKAAADGGAVVGVLVTDEAARNSPHSVFFRLLDAELTPKGPFVLKAVEKKASAKATGLKVTMVPDIPGVFHLQVEGDTEALAAGIQAYSDDGTKITVKADGVPVGNPNQASADFNAGDNGAVLVEISVSEETAREKDRPVYFKLTSGKFGAKGPFILKKVEKKIAKVEKFKVEPQSGRFKGRVPFQAQLISTDMADVSVVIRANNATARLRIETESNPTPIEVTGQTTLNLKGDDRLRVIHITLIGAVRQTQIFFDANAASGVLNQGPFNLQQTISASVTP